MLADKLLSVAPSPAVMSDIETFLIAIENARLMSETLEMKRTLEARKLIERAKGILQQKYGLTEEEAYLRLRNESRRLRRPMRDLAEAVILADDLERKKGVDA